MTTPKHPLILFLALGAVLVAAVMAGCGDFPDSPPLGPSPTVTPNVGPGVAANGETAEQAAKRLFPRALHVAFDALNRRERQALEGTKPGDPVPVSRDYRIPMGTLAQWVLPDDLHAGAGSMFAAMWPIAMVKDGFLVPVVKDGRVVSEFGVGLNSHGRWVLELQQGWIGPVPGGWLCDLQLASEKLEDLLDSGTVVRPVTFVPSGLAFAVGDNGRREAAVFLSWVGCGPGVEGFDKQLPQAGQLFTPAQLKTLLTP